MNIPTSWCNITIEQYLSVDDILKQKDKPQLERDIEMLAILLNCSVEHVEDMGIEDFREAIKKISFLFEPIPNFKIPVDFKIDDVVYSFDPITPIKTFGQFVDISTFTNDPDMNTQNMHNILACLCVEKDGYKRSNHREKAELFYKKMTMDKALPIAVFFCEVFRKSLPIIQDYLVKEVKKNMTEANQILMEEMRKAGRKDILSNGDGTLQ